MRFNVAILLIYSIILGIVNSTFLDYDSSLNIQIFHDITNSDQFTSRGNVTISSISTADITINQKPLTADEKLQLKKLAVDDKFYRLKFVVSGTDGVRKTYLASSKACALLQSHLNDDLTISFDHLSAVLGIHHKSILLPGSPTSCTEEFDVKNIGDFYTTINFKLIELAPTPDTASFIQKVEKERDARERGETKDNRSFLAKYWMYIVPCVILLLISGVTNPEAQNGGGASAGGGR